MAELSEFARQALLTLGLGFKLAVLVQALHTAAFEPELLGAATLDQVADRFEAEIFHALHLDPAPVYASTIAQWHDLLVDETARSCLTEDATRACLLEDFHHASFPGAGDDQSFYTRCAAVTP
ncbi:Hypothetical Protein FCC1311_046282 [Hondaea fermentalgiana]|uniref:Uncharacterized protein n=1 Tax=Hondaea fermentalgiana TaxID=2315210 RepID=A0A2R5GCV9_9STRA|nr:Hypothetical Protein FCC1311_046282 [Hondaea fermentalgiana]|eukprot:GBG28405.1 Hypothetical Protein FCC1311_046282 [Hondaea fermentalgiana]